MAAYQCQKSWANIRVNQPTNPCPRIVIASTFTGRSLSLLARCNYKACEEKEINWAHTKREAAGNWRPRAHKGGLCSCPQPVFLLTRIIYIQYVYIYVNVVISQSTPSLFLPAPKELFRPLYQKTFCTIVCNLNHLKTCVNHCVSICSPFKPPPLPPNRTPQTAPSPPHHHSSFFF